ncbi:MAG: DinB family protein, partial [Chitinophagaceae bacterium]|nr:DinB family protein [Chitinophagaceae bacterium]
MKNTATLHYIDQLRKAMDGDVWIDETFADKLDYINEGNAFIRPLPIVHSVAEVISHLLEWRISILSNLRGVTRTITSDSPANWRTNEELSPIGWQSLLAAFNKSQQEIIETLSDKEDPFLLQMAKNESHDLQYYV